MGVSFQRFFIVLVFLWSGFAWAEEENGQDDKQWIEDILSVRPKGERLLNSEAIEGLDRGIAKSQVSLLSKLEKEAADNPFDFSDDEVKRSAEQSPLGFPRVKQSLRERMSLSPEGRCLVGSHIRGRYYPLGKIALAEVAYAQETDEEEI